MAADIRTNDTANFLIPFAAVDNCNNPLNIVVIIAITNPIANVTKVTVANNSPGFNASITYSLNVLNPSLRFLVNSFKLFLNFFMDSVAAVPSSANFSRPCINVLAINK